LPLSIIEYESRAELIHRPATGASDESAPGKFRTLVQP